MDSVLPAVVELVRRSATGAGLTDGPAADIGPDTQLADLGFGSLALVGLLIDVEARFAVSLPEELVTAQSFRSPRDLAAAISTARADAPDAAPDR